MWKGNKNGQFSVKDYYNSLEEGALLKGTAKILWNPYAPSKVSFFTWDAWWGKVLTMNKLKKRGYQLVSICPFCTKNEDNLDHILICCSAIWELWATIPSVTGISRVCPYMVKDLFCAWSQLPVKKTNRKLWWVVPLCFYWAIWKERNRIMFEDAPFSPSRLKHSIISSLLFWAEIMPDVDTFFFYKWTMY